MEQGEREILDLLELLGADPDPGETRALPPAILLAPGGEAAPAGGETLRDPSAPYAVRALTVEERLPFRSGAEGLLIELSLIGLLSAGLREKLLDRLQNEEAGTVGREEAMEAIAGLLREDSLDRTGSCRITLRQLGKRMTVQ